MTRRLRPGEEGGGGRRVAGSGRRGGEGGGRYSREMAGGDGDCLKAAEMRFQNIG